MFESDVVLAVPADLDYDNIPYLPLYAGGS